MAPPLRNSGVDPVGDVPWGTHFCHFFQTKNDLLDPLLPFFKAGLESQEFCLWVVCGPLTTKGARSALQRAVPDLDRYIEAGCIEIHRSTEWYQAVGIDARKLVEAWERRLGDALDRGFAGMRASGSAAFLKEQDWGAFVEYERRFNDWVADKRLLVACSYPMAVTGAAEVLDVAKTHSLALARRNGAWEVLENPEFQETQADLQRLNTELQRRVTERTARLRSVNVELEARNRQQSALAALGQTAIRCRDLTLLLDEAASVTGQTLGASLILVGERLSGDEVKVRAGVGWGPGVAGSTLKGGGASMASFILGSDEPVLVDDVGAERRFQVLAAGEAVQSALGTAVRGRSGPWGALVVYSRRPRSFSPDEVAFVQSVANILSLAVERDEVERAQRREKETLEAIFDNIPVMISISDGSERLWRVNREWERTLGWSLEEARTADLLNECYPDPEWREKVLQFYREVQSRWSDFPMRTRDHRPIEIAWACFDTSDGSRISLGLDITERKRAEKEKARILESESHARAEAEAALERLRDIHSITELALSRLALDDLLKELLTRLRKALGGDFAFIQLIDEGSETLSIRAADGDGLENLPPVKVPMGEAVAGRIAADGKPRIVHDLSQTDVTRIEGLPPKLHTILQGSMMGTPLQVEGRVVGVVSVATREPRQFSEEDLRLLQMVADRVAPAIEGFRLAEEVRSSGEQLKTLSRRLLTAQEKERRRLAVELHDELGQVLTAVKINLASLEREAGVEMAPTRLRDAIASVDRAMERVRDLALDLRPSVLDDLGLPAAIRWYTDRFARSTDTKVHLAIDEVPDLSPELETACFRVAQEALTNVARHARADNVWVSLHLVRSEVHLRIRDDGIGFDAITAREHALGGGSLGLLGMQERVSLSGGDFELSTRPGGGTEVIARLPLDAPSSDSP